MLEILPYAFTRVEIWSISREFFEMNQPCPTTRRKRLDLFSTVDVELVPDDQRLLVQIVRQASQKYRAILASHRASPRHRRQVSCRANSAHDRQMFARQQDLEERRLAARGVSSRHTRQQVKGRLVNASNQAPFALRFFFSSGQISLRQRATSSSLRRMSNTRGFCGVQPKSFSKRETWLLWYLTPNSHSMICGARSQVQISSRNPYSVAPCASNSGSDSSSSGVSFGSAPFRGRACKASSPPSRTAFIHLLTAAFVTPSASAISSWAQPSFLSSIARKRRISFQSGLRISLEVIPKF